MDLDPAPDAPFRLSRVSRVTELGVAASVANGGQERAIDLRTQNARLLSLYTAAGCAGDLEKAAVDGIQGDHADRSRVLGDSVTASWTRYEPRGDTDDVHRAIEHSEQLRMATPVAQPTHLLAGLCLASSLYTRYEHMEEQDDLRRAVLVSLQCVAEAPRDHPARAECLDALAGHLLARFRLVEVVEDLQSAVARGEEAVLCAVGTPARAWYLENQAFRLRYRYSRTGAIEDLQRAAAMVEEAHNEAATLADETIHLASTFQHAGFSHVPATQ